MKRADGRQPMQHTQRIVILDHNVKNALLYINSVQKKLPGGQILVQANFQNRFPNEDVWAEVKFEFQDENNMMVDSTEWVNTHFAPWVVTMVQGNSISGRAVKHVTLMRSLRTRNGNLPGTFGLLFEIPWFHTTVPQ
jgi:hypothetical protein